MQGISLDPLQLYNISETPSREMNLKNIKNKDLMKVCKQFESIFINMMFKQMRKNIPKNDIMHGGMAEDIFKDFLYDEYSQKLADKESFGLSKMLYNQLSSYI